MASLKIKELLCLLYSALLFLSGVLLIGFSVVLTYKIFYHFKFVPSNTIGPFIVLFLLGFVHLFLTWLGVKGPTREHDFHIILFMFITLVLLLTECAVGIWSIMLWSDADVESLQLVTDSYNALLKNDIDKKDWARLESELKCCGIHGIKDYKEIKNVIPLSCCNLKDSSCPDVHDTGCIKPLARYVKGILIDAAVMGFCCCIFHGLGLFTYVVFFKGLKEERKARLDRRLAAQRTVSQDNTSSPNPVPSSPPPPTTSA